MRKLILICILIALSYQISKSKLRGKQHYTEEKRKPEQFKKLKYCKIHKCITSDDMKQEAARNAKDGGEEAPAFKKKQQKCFYECQMEYCAAKHQHGTYDCKHDADGLEYKPIFDEKDPQFRDYAPTEQELDEYLAVNNDPLVKKYKKSHYKKGE